MKNVITKMLVYLALFWATTTTAQIININADVNDIPNPIFISLNAGTYEITAIGVADGGIYDAWSNWSSTTCTQPMGCPLTTPTTFTGWRSAYDVISPDIVSVSVEDVLLTPMEAQPSGEDFFRDHFLMNNSTVRFHVDDQAVYPDSLSALAAGRTSMFTLNTSGLVGFSINDIRPLGDNRGGMSLQVTAVPLPPAILLFIFGLAGLATTQRKRFQQ